MKSGGGRTLASFSMITAMSSADHGQARSYRGARVPGSCLNGEIAPGPRSRRYGWLGLAVVQSGRRSWRSIPSLFRVGLSREPFLSMWLLAAIIWVAYLSVKSRNSQITSSGRNTLDSGVVFVPFTAKSPRPRASCMRSRLSGGANHLPSRIARSTVRAHFPCGTSDIVRPIKRSSCRPIRDARRASIRH